MYFVSLFTFALSLAGALAAPQLSTEQEIGNTGNTNANTNIDRNDIIIDDRDPILGPETSTEAASQNNPSIPPEIAPKPDGNEPITEGTDNPRGEGGVVLPEDSAFPQFGPNEVTPEMLRDFVLYREFSAITYCPDNNDSPGGPLSAAPADTVDGCPRVASTLRNMNTVLEFEDTPKTDTTGYLVTSHIHRKHILAFRGTHSRRNILTNLKFVLTETDICPDCTAARGFWTAWLEARDLVRKGMKEATEEFPDYEIVVTGHSLGGAVATLAAAQLRNDGYKISLYTFGAPRIGGEAISDYITRQPGGNFRITHLNDPVPRLPSVGVFDYVHISPEYFISTPNDRPVIPSDIKVLEGSLNKNGNSGSGIPKLSAHNFYFANVDQCCASNVPSSPLLALLQG